MFHCVCIRCVHDCVFIGIGQTNKAEKRLVTLFVSLSSLHASSLLSSSLLSFLPPSLPSLPPSHVLVYNLGAHTLTLTLLLVTSGMYSEVVTRCVCDVGGRECDKVIADFLATEFER